MLKEQVARADSIRESNRVFQNAMIEEVKRLNEVVVHKKQEKLQAPYQHLVRTIRTSDKPDVSGFK